MYCEYWRKGYKKPETSISDIFTAIPFVLRHTKDLNGSYIDSEIKDSQNSNILAYT
jgi:hypothetical protein